jgi:ABC-type uncharacterized transport system auxiliary subunit
MIETAAILLVAGIGISCGAARPVNYYSLEPMPTTPAADAPASQIPVTLLVEHVTSNELYRDVRLVYGMSREELGTYEYERWAEPPVDMIQEELVTALRDTRQFHSVEAIASRLRGDYLVRAHLEALDEVDKPQMSARFSIRVELYDPKTAAVVWSDSYSHDDPVTGKKVRDVVAALDQNVKTGLNQLASSLAQYVASHPSAK